MTDPALPRVALGHVLLVIRHGETDWNVAGRLQGRDDIPLNDRGRGQATANGRQLADLIDRLGLDAADMAFLASPLSRARETMRLARAAAGLDPDGFAVDERLAELAFGRWSGLTLAEIADADPAGWAAREADRWNHRPPGGESMADGARRVAPLLAGLDRPAVVVTHGGLNRALRVVTGAAGLAEAIRMHTPQDRIALHEGERVRWA